MRSGLWLGLRDGLFQLWLGCVAIVLSVGFVVAGTMAAESVRQLLVQQQVDLPLGTTAVLTVDTGRVPATGASIGLPATDATVELLDPESGALFEAERPVLLADEAFVRMLEGAAPEDAGQLAIDPRTARVLAAVPGDPVDVRHVAGDVREWTISGIVDPLAHPEAVAVTGDGMQQLLGEGFDQILLSGTSDANAAAVASLGLGERAVLTESAGSIAEQQSVAGRSLGVLGLLLSSLTLVCAVAGAFVIGNTFQVVAANRRQQAALLRAIGATQAQVRRRFLGEAILLGLAASVLGALLGSTAGMWISDLVGMPISPSSGLLAVGVALGVTVTVVGVWGPVRRLAGVSPVVALASAEVTEAEAPTRAGWAKAAPLLAATVLALQVPIVGAVVGGLLTFIALVILGPLLVPKMGAWVMAGPGRRGAVARIARANVTRYPARAARTSTAVLLGIALAASTTALVSTLDAVHALDTRNEVSIYAPTVTEAMASELAALPGVVDAWQPDGSEAVIVFAGSREAFEATVAIAIADWPAARIGTAEDRTSDLAGALSWIAASLGAVAVMSLLVGSVGVLNTVHLTVKQRRREFAVLRAVGMTRAELVRMVAAEASGLTGIGAVMGLLLAGATIYGMLGMASLLLVPLISWWQVALICGGVVALVAAGSLVPARSASRIQPATAVAQTAH